MDPELPPKNSSDKHGNANLDTLTRQSSGYTELNLGARDEVPPSWFYGKLEYRARKSESLPSSAPQQYVHIYTLPTPPVEPDSDSAPPTSAQPCDSDPSEDVMMASLIKEGPEPEEEPDNMPAEEDPDVIKDVDAIPAAVLDGQERQAPTQVQALKALKDLMNILRPPRTNDAGYTDPQIDPFSRIRMEGMQTLLNFFTNKKSNTYDKWSASGCQAAISLG